MNRRQALTLLTGSAGALVGAGFYGRYALMPPPPSEHLAGVQELAARLYSSMDPAARAVACVPYDHPLRQYHNRGVRCGGLEITPGNFSREQRVMLNDLLHAGLSEQGRARVPHEYYIQWFGIHMMNVTICGNPAVPPYQVILSGPHLNLRLGGRSREGVAFGGPQVYGDQRGDSRQGLPGNLYRFQFERAHRLFASLDPAQKRTALVARTPIQTQIELRGKDGPFDGVPVTALSQENRTLVTGLIADILSSYPPDDVAEAQACLAANGGVDALSLSYYEEGEVDGSGQYQIFRLEGPAAVLYFRGFPHVHAFINIAMNGDEPLSVGEIVGVNPAVMEGEQVKQLFESAMLDRTGADFAWYEPESVVGRLRKGLIRTGDIYNLESWQEAVTVSEVKGGRIRGPLLEQIRRLGADPSPDRTYTVATSGPAGGSSRPVIRLRDATIAYLTKRWGGASDAAPA